jgi:hypothetical protein
VVAISNRPPGRSIRRSPCRTRSGSRAPFQRHAGEDQVDAGVGQGQGFGVGREQFETSSPAAALPACALKHAAGRVDGQTRAWGKRFMQRTGLHAGAAAQVENRARLEPQSVEALDQAAGGFGCDGGMPVVVRGGGMKTPAGMAVFVVHERWMII